MARRFAVSIVLVSVALLGGCGGDDTVNPANPDAGPPPKVTDGATDGPKDGASDGARHGSDAAGDAPGDASSDAPHEAGTATDASNDT
jgi:hypothetical protein